jgi:hypothetical protein
MQRRISTYVLCLGLFTHRQLSECYQHLLESLLKQRQHRQLIHATTCVQRTEWIVVSHYTRRRQQV